MLRWGPYPTDAVRAGATHRLHLLLSVSAVKPARPGLDAVNFTIHFTVVKVRAGERGRQRCWTCALVVRVGLPHGASFLFYPVIVAVCLVLGARPRGPWWRGVFCAHQGRLLPMPQRRRVDPRRTGLTEEEEVLKKNLVDRFFSPVCI